MVDHIRTLLINPSDVQGYGRVVDAPADAVMQLFGVLGDGSSSDCNRVDSLLPLVYADDLAEFRVFFDSRRTPESRSVYGTESAEMLPSRLYDDIMSDATSWELSALFQHDDPTALSVLSQMYSAARCGDSQFALGAVLLACAYRRMLLQKGDA